jgi:hypothetical protein
LADVFISYKRRIRPTVERIARELERQNFSVWYDANLDAGRDFSEEVSNQLHAAKSILVCWTNDCFPGGGDQNGWVRGEATIARERGALVSAIIEPTRFDPPWNMVHHEDLTALTTTQADWDADPNWQAVLAAVARRVQGIEISDAPPPSRPVEAKRTLAKPRYLAAWIGLATVGVAAAVALVFVMTKPEDKVAAAPPAVTAEQPVAPAPAAPPKTEVEFLDTPINLENASSLEGIACRNFDKIIHLNLSVEWPAESMITPTEEEPSLVFWTDSTQYMFPEGSFSYKLGAYVVKGYFIAREGGMHQGITAYAFEKIDDAQVMTSANFVEVPAKGPC